jgi:hypothetical protein
MKKKKEKKRVSRCILTESKHSIYMYVCVCMYACMYVHVHVCMHMYVYIYMYIYCIYVHTHTLIYTYITLHNDSEPGVLSQLANVDAHERIHNEHPRNQIAAACIRQAYVRHTSRCIAYVSIRASAESDLRRHMSRCIRQHTSSVVTCAV